MRELQEKKDYVIHDIAPGLSKDIVGELEVFFPMALTKINFVLVGMRIVDKQNSKLVLASFGVHKVEVGRTWTLRGLDHVVNFPNSKLNGNLQVKVIGTVGDFVKAELRIVSPDDFNTCVFTFGTKLVQLGKGMILHGMDHVIKFISDKRMIS